MNLEELQGLVDVAALRATIDGVRHADYDHVVALRDLYIKLISGKDIDQLLKRFVRREDEVMFEQRKLMTQAITPSVSAQLMAPFYKVTRVNNITCTLDYPETEGFVEKKARVEKAIAEYNGDLSLDDYLDTRFIELSFTDPNAFIVTDFFDGLRDEEGNLKTPVVPYPIEITSIQALNFQYTNNSLQWLIAFLDGRYVMYLANIAVGASAVSPEMFPLVPKGMMATQIDPGTGNEVVVYRTENNLLWVIEVFEHNSQKIPAKRVGYKRDLSTDGRTYVSPMHDAMPYFMKSIKTVSEFDLTMALHAHPQKLQQSPKCTGTQDTPCHNGYDPDGKVCSKCGGEGVLPISTTAQDAIVVPMSKDKDNMIDLANLVKYVELPVELLKFQEEHIERLTQKALQAMYNSEVFSKTTVVATATEKKQSMESVYDVLMPFSKQYSAFWKSTVMVIAEYVDAPNVITEHKFPKDFGFRTRDELIAQLSTASESSAPSYVKKALSRELGQSLFVDKPAELQRIEVKELLFPFGDKNQAELAMIISSDLTPLFDKVLWANFDQIFDKLETEQEEKGIYLYDLAMPRIKELVDAAVIEKLQVIENPTLSLDLSSLEESNIEEQTDEQKELTSLVGFATIIFQAQEKVSAGTSTKEAAAFALHKLAGWPLEECERVIGDPKPAAEIIAETEGAPIP